MNGTDVGAKNHFDEILAQTEATIELFESINKVKLEEAHKQNYIKRGFIMFIINCNKAYKELLTSINKHGNEVNGTYELTAEKVTVSMCDTDTMKGCLI